MPCRKPASIRRFHPRINPAKIERELAFFLEETSDLDVCACAELAAWFVHYAREEGVL